MYYLFVFEKKPIFLLHELFEKFSVLKNGDNILVKSGNIEC